ncbi:MAG: substrate-binding domain-containing protein [Pirellulales bacterium]|nr:substrate-binding domain-containing protein [Pirellulales bacterium]
MDIDTDFGMMDDMINTEIHPPHISALADKLVIDIRRRGLSVGDRYLTTEVVSRMLGVRKAVAGKAMRQLADRQILISKPRGGTFVGPGLGRQNRSKVQTIYVLIPTEDPSASYWSFQPFIAGIRGEIAGVNVQFTFLPDEDPVGYVRESIHVSLESGQLAGIVAVSSPPSVLRCLAELRLPTVLYGTPYSSELPISYVETDNLRIGRLMVEYLLGRGHKRIAVLMTGAGRPGNDLLIDGAIEALAAAGLAPNAMILRSVRNDVEAYRATAKELMARSDRPTAIFTRGGLQAAALASIASDVGLDVPDDLEIIFEHGTHDQTVHHFDVKQYPRVESTLSYVETAAMIGKMLKEMSAGMPPKAHRVLIPVTLHEPDRCVNGSTRRRGK